MMSSRSSSSSSLSYEPNATAGGRCLAPVTAATSSETPTPIPSSPGSPASPSSPPTSTPPYTSSQLTLIPTSELSSIFSSTYTLDSMATKAAFRPSRARQGITSFHLRQYAQATLGSGSLRKVVMLPEGEDENEWLAFNLVDFYNQINLLFGAVSEFCTEQSCPDMKATDEFEYLWQDNDKYRKPTKMPAHQYVEHLMNWIQKNVDDDKVFASRNGVEFAPDFRALMLQFFKRLARVYAHIYCHHFPVVGALALDKHMNTSFKHFVLFVKEFKLDVGRDYWGPLNELVDSMMASADQ